MTTEITIVVVPRDHYYHAIRSLESIIEQTTIPFELIYVNHTCPQNIAVEIRDICKKQGFSLIESEKVLSPNQARNSAISKLKTPYVVFVDNDVIVTRGWLNTLLTSLQNQAAWIVSPTYLIGEIEKGKIHMAGGDIQFPETTEDKRYYEHHLHMDKKLTDIADKLQSGETDFGEFHCLLAKTEIFDRLGLLDENLLSHGEHLDLCMAVKQAGGKVYYEPSSVVTYLIPTQLPPPEIAYYLLRWGDDWNRRSIQHFCQKWNIGLTDPYRDHLFKYLTMMRRRALKRVSWPVGNALNYLLYKTNQNPLIVSLVDYIEQKTIRKIII
jgi:glycosyltransferase involved in cell wall biosynthesis